MNDVAHLAVISSGLSVPAWAGRDRQTLPAFLLLEQVLQPGRQRGDRVSSTEMKSSDSTIKFWKKQLLSYR